ncbi:MAG: hypothetical protein IPK19_38880 [Chloroflexi bacterium]|nr:hypothetical protein [Chloroflexota bacterium]
MPRISPSPIQHTLWEIERRWGQGALTRASMLDAGRTISTGFAALDALLDRGGIAVGQMSAVAGMPTSGATTLVYRLIAGAQEGDGIAAYVDLSGTFDPEYAVGCGVALDRLLIAATRSPERGLAIALDAIRSEQVALVALDGSTAERQIDAEALDRLRANVARTQCALVLLSRGIHHPALLHSLIQLRYTGWVVDASGSVQGYHTRAEVLRDGGTERNRSAMLAIELSTMRRGTSEGEPSA